MLIPCDSRDEDGFDTRLRFSEKLYGRDAESKRLETIFASFCRQSKCQDVNVNVDDEQGSKETVEQTNSENPFVLIGGYSGAGKSALVDRFIKQMKRYKSPAQQATTSELKDFYFLSGKFDEFKGGVSYSALVQAFTAFFDSLLDDCPAEELESLREGILSAVGDEGKLITTLLPSLQQVIGEQTVEVASINMIKEFEFNRLRFVFKSFMRAICTEERPAVLFLDDLQWMDGASLRLIMDLVTDKSVPHLMFLGAFRSNEVDETHILSMALSEVENNEGKTIERIDLSNLPSEAIGEFIADTLNLDVAQISTLKEVVCKKTRGNILFARKTLEYLHKKEALWRSHLNYQWTWEVQKVNDITQFSDNVVDMLMATITTLPEQLQQALATASFLRSAFAVDMVLKLMEIDGHTTSSEKLTELLDMAVAEGLLVQVATPPNADYRFAHDRIKQAACELIPAGEARDEKCLRLCNYLIERGLSSDGEDWMLFVAAGHLNVMESPKISFLELAQLNLQVGQKASNVAAFVPAASYLQKGLEALRKIDQFWDVHCELALDLHRAAGDVELCLGHFDRGNELCQGVIAHTRSTADKMRMKLSLGRALGKQQKAEAAVHTHLDALHLIDEFPRNFHMIHLLKDVSYIKKYINSHTNHEILMLPRMTDENKILAMEHLSELAMRAWICNKPSLTLMAILRQLRLSFKHGLSPDSAHSFYQYGMIWYGKFGDQEGANRMGRLSKEILFKAHRAEKVKAKNRECCLLVNLVAFIDAWGSPIPQTLQTLQLAYKSGMESGDLENGHRAWAASHLLAFGAGFPLDPIEKAGRDLLWATKKYHLEFIRSMVYNARTVIVHLMGREEAPLDWTELDKINVGVTNPSEVLQRSWWCWSRLQLAYYFNELEIADRLVGPYAKLSKINTFYMVVTIRVYFSGLIASGLLKKTGKRKYKGRAKKALQEMKGLMQSRGLNNLHRCWLMEADYAAAKRMDLRLVKGAYDKAIAAAGKAGFRQDAALGNELAGEYFLSLGDDYWPRHYFSKSHELYDEWGAKAKTDQLFKTRGDYIDIEKKMKRSTFSSGLRYWVSGEDSKIHNAVDLELLSRNISRTDLASSLGKISGLGEKTVPA